MGWVTGPITGHPNQSSLKASQITTTAYSWGIVGSEQSIGYERLLFPSLQWGNHGYVVGAAQAGNQVVFHLFTNLDNIEDKSASLTLCETVC